MKPKPMKRDEIANVVHTAVSNAVDYIESEIAEDRLKAQRYFDGEVDIGHEEGRSKVVATKCRDTVRAIKPALMRTFLASEKPVEFLPKQPDDVQPAEQATAYTEWKFNQSGGYRLIHDAIHDALIKKTGIVKAFYEEKERTEVDEYTGLSMEEMAFLVNEEDLEILEYEEEIEEMDGQEIPTYNLKVSRKFDDGDITIQSIAPEDFFVNREATRIEDAYVCGHRNSDMRVGDLVAMGYDFAEVIDYAGDADSAMQQEADLERAGVSTFGDDESAEDPTMQRIMVTEAYMKMDIEGAGIPQSYRFVLLGQKYHLLDYELCDEVPFAVFEVDPEPHTFFGRSLVEIIIDDQDAATSMLRGLLDNVALVNNPGVQVGPGANMEDLLNNEIGAIRRVKNIGDYAFDQIPFVGGQALPALQYYDEQIENKTGVSRASMGLDPDALQNTTAAAVNATVQAATAQVELIARNLAEGGMKQLFRLIMKLTRQHVDHETMMRLNGNIVPVDPRSWKADMDLVANVGLGTGGEVEREMVLREVLGYQMQIWQGYGPGNGLVTMTGIRNTLADLMKSGGLQNADRFFEPMDPQKEQMLIQQAQQAQAQQQGSDPNAAFLQAEQMKVQAKAQTDQMKLQQQGQADQLKLQADMLKASMEDDRKRDEMIQKRVLEAAKLLGEYNIKVDQAAIQAMQASNGPQVQ